MGPLVTTTGSHAFVVKQALSLSLSFALSASVRLIHIDVQKLGMTRRS